MHMETQETLRHARRGYKVTLDGQVKRIRPVPFGCVPGGIRRLRYALGLFGCVSTGVQVDESALTSFQKGKTTINEVIARLGQPTSNILLDSGQRVIAYTYVQAQARPESFIPIIGPLVGGADSHFSNVSLTFDQGGVLQSYTSAQSQFGSANGVASGTTGDDRVKDQPRKSGSPN